MDKCEHVVVDSGATRGRDRLKQVPKCADMPSGRCDASGRAIVTPTAQEVEVALTLEEAREHVRSKVRADAGRIADALIEDAKGGGGLAAAKYLFEITGLYPVSSGDESNERSVADLFLKRLGLPTDSIGGDDESVDCEDKSEPGFELENRDQRIEMAETAERRRPWERSGLE